MIQISPEALRDGCERAKDLFLLGRLTAHEDSAAVFTAAYEALGVDSAMREHLEEALVDLIPVKGLPVVEATAAASMLSGVLIGLLIADSAHPVEELDLPVLPD